MKNLEILKNQFKNYFHYMFEKNQFANESDAEIENKIKNYSFDSFLELDELLENINFRNLEISDFSNDEIGEAYDSAIEELLTN
jgi:hypothetical protein